MKKNLYDLIVEAKQKNEESMMKIIDTFMPLIKKYGRKLAYDGAESDIVILIIELVKYCSIFNKGEFIQDKDIISYINISVKHEYIRLSKKFSKVVNTEVELNENIYLIQSNEDIENMLIVNELLDKLPDSQRSVLEELFLIGRTQASLAKKLNISRQAVNKAKIKALTKLREYIKL